MARSTRSGTLVGPGIWRKCLPVCTVIWRPSRVFCHEAVEYHYLAGLSPAGRASSMHKKLSFCPVRSQLETVFLAGKTDSARLRAGGAQKARYPAGTGRPADDI